MTTIFWSTWGRIGTIEEATCEAANPFVCDNNNNMFAIGLDLYQDFREQLQASFGLATYKNKFFWETMGPLIIRHIQLGEKKDWTKRDFWSKTTLIMAGWAGHVWILSIVK